jgi:hypothetical protein
MASADWARRPSVERKGQRPTRLDELHAGIDFVPAEPAHAGLYPSAKGEKAWPPLAMALLLVLTGPAREGFAP